MKEAKDYVREALKKRDEYLEKKRKRKKIMYIVSECVFVAVVVFLVITVVYLKLHNISESGKKVEVATNNKETDSPNTGETSDETTKATSENKETMGVDHNSNATDEYQRFSVETMVLQLLNGKWGIDDECYAGSDFYFVYKNHLYRGSLIKTTREYLLYDTFGENDDFQAVLKDRGYSVNKYDAVYMKDIIPLAENECSYGDVKKAYIYENENEDNVVAMELKFDDGSIYRMLGSIDSYDLAVLRKIVDYRKGDISYTGKGMDSEKTNYIYDGKTAAESFDFLLKCDIAEEESALDCYDAFLTAKLSEESYIEVAQLKNSGAENNQLALFTVHDGDDVSFYRIYGRME